MEKILIIEDEQDLREAMQARLVTEGYSVRTVSTSEEGLHLILESKPDLILLDVLTSSIHGAAFMQRLRTLPDEQNDCKVIVVTNLDNDITRDKFAPYHIDGYLVKAEVTLDTIAEEVAKVFGRNAPSA
ncbi:MAG: response regulator [Candidatus Pacebacteria bacterium]|jgi:DNA-binding response OmpR family regulator|nr:response regulator [Candidatus Paceibacterota bacterium]